MRAAARAILATVVVYLLALAATALAFGLDWTVANRLPLLAASLGLGAAVGVQHVVYHRLA